MDDSIIQVVSHINMDQMYDIQDGKNEGRFILKVYNMNYFYF